MNQKKNLDTIFIKDLLLKCTIGVSDTERIHKQPIAINVNLSIDTKKAALTDNVSDTVDYKKIYLGIIDIAENSSFKLLETLADHIAKFCLQDKRIEQAKIRVEKLKRLPLAKSTGIEIIRNNN